MFYNPLFCKPRNSLDEIFDDKQDSGWRKKPMNQQTMMWFSDKVILKENTTFDETVGNKKFYHNI